MWLMIVGSYKCMERCVWILVLVCIFKVSIDDSTSLVRFKVCLYRTYFFETENWKHCSKIIFKCVNTLWDQFLIKNYWKMRFVGPVNNARDRLICWKRIEKSNCAVTVHEQYINSNRNSENCLLNACQKKKKKKKKRETWNRKHRRTIGSIQTLIYLAGLHGGRHLPIFNLLVHTYGCIACNLQEVG